MPSRDFDTAATTVGDKRLEQVRRQLQAKFPQRYDNFFQGQTQVWVMIVVVKEVGAPFASASPRVLNGEKITANPFLEPNRDFEVFVLRPI